MPLEFIDNLGAIGIVRDAAPHELPLNAWSDGKNVHFSDGYVERMKGQQVIYDPPSVLPYHLLPYSSGSSRFWIYAGAAKMYSVTGTTHTNITRQSGGVDVDYTATANNVWTSGVLGGIVILSNGVDVPQQWAGTGKAANLSNFIANTTCKAFRTYKNYGLALHTTESGAIKPHRVRWSHPADPGSAPTSWDDTDATKDAGLNDLSATSDRLMDGLQMGDHFYLYKESSIYRMSYIRGQYIFSFSDPISTEAGALALNCIVQFPGGHVVLGQGDVFVNNGSQAESILNQRMRRWLQTSMDATYYARSFLVANPTKNEIWICIPRVGASVPNIALIWNWKDNTFTFRDLPGAHFAASGVIDATASNSIDSRTNSIDSYTDAIDYQEYTQASQRLIIADDSTKLYLADSSRLFDGSNYQAYVSREGMHLGEPNYYKLIQTIQPKFEGGVGNQINVYIGGKNELGASTNWTDPVPFTIGTDTQVDFGDALEWRYLAVKFETTMQSTWRLKSYGIEYEKTGVY